MEINVPKWLRVDEIISSKTKKRKSVYLSACTAWFIVNELKSIALYYSKVIESTLSCLDGKPCCTFDMYRACNNTTLSIASLDSLDFLHHSFFFLSVLFAGFFRTFHSVIKWFMLFLRCNWFCCLLYTMSGDARLCLMSWYASCFL